MYKLTAESIFVNHRVDFTCSNCKNTMKILFKELMKEGNTIVCPSCGANIIIQHTDETKKGLKEVDKALADLENALKNLGR